MITKKQIIDIARDELTPIGWHEEHAKYIDGLDAFAERLVKLCNISPVSNRRELLFAFEEYWNVNNCDGENFGEVVDKFLANNCC